LQLRLDLVLSGQAAGAHYTCCSSVLSCLQAVAHCLTRLGQMRLGWVKFRFTEDSVELQGHQAGPYNSQSVVLRHNNEIITLDEHQPYP